MKILIIISFLVFINTNTFAKSDDSKITQIHMGYAEIASPPYQLEDSSQVPITRPGIVIDFLKDLFKSENIDVKFTRFPNKRVLFELEKGTIDAAFSYSFQEERLKFGVYPLKNNLPDSEKRVFTLSYLVYKLTNNPIFVTSEGLIKSTNKDFVLGVNSGYSVIQDLEKQNLKYQEAKDIQSNLKKLLNKHISGYVGQEQTVDIVLKTFSQDANKVIKKVLPPIVQKDYYLLFNHQFYNKNKPLAESIWNKIAKTRNKSMQKLFAKYTK